MNIHCLPFMIVGSTAARAEKMGFNCCRSDKEHTWECIHLIFSLLWGSFLSHFHFLQMNQYFLSNKRKQSHNLTSHPHRTYYLTACCSQLSSQAVFLQHFNFSVLSRNIITLTLCILWCSYLLQILQFFSNTESFYQVTGWISCISLENGKMDLKLKKKNLSSRKTCLYLPNKFSRDLIICH